jgi:hypothetical protein
MVHGWECRGSPAMWQAVLVVVGTRCFCFRFLFASYDLPCTLDGQSAPHTYPTVSIVIGDLPWTCTLGMHLGHAPRHLGCHVPHLVPPWGMHAAPWTLDLGPWTLDLGVQHWIRGPSDPHCLELPARKGKGAVGWAGLGAGRAPVSRWALRRVQPPRLVGSPGFPVPPPRVVLAQPHRAACPDWQSPCSPATSGGRRRRHAHALRPVASPGWQALYRIV